MKRYKVAVWDHEKGRWSCALAGQCAEGPARRLSRADAVAMRRKLYRQGWSEVSVLVVREARRKGQEESAC